MKTIEQADADAGIWCEESNRLRSLRSQTAASWHPYPSPQGNNRDRALGAAALAAGLLPRLALSQACASRRRA